MLYYRIFPAMVACFFLPAVGLTTEGKTVAALRERIEVLGQARDKAAAELTAREQQGTVTSRDRGHYRTVTTFLDKQITESCRQLIDKGGTEAIAELPCPDKAAAPEKVEEKKPAGVTGDQVSQKQHEKEGVPEARQLPPEAVPVKREKVEKADTPQQPPATGFFAAIRRWWESLLAPKPPPVTSGSETGQPREQRENTATEEKRAQQSGDSVAQQAEQVGASESKESAAGSGSQGQPDEPAGMEKDISGERGERQKQEQQQLKDGDTQASGGGQEPGHGQAVGDDTQKTAGQEKGASENSPGTAGLANNKQSGTENGNSSDVTGNGGAGQKAANGEKEGSGGQKSRQGISTSGIGNSGTADAGKGGKKQRTGQKDGSAQQLPEQPVGQSMAETRNRQQAPVQSGPGIHQKTGQLEQQDPGPTPAADEEVSRLEKSLNDVLGEFDGKLLNEQERLAARVPKQREGSAAGSGGYGAEGPLGPAGGGGIAGGGYGGEEGDGRAGAGGYEQPGSAAAGGGKPAPAEGRSTIDTDDDIVARQLREAAEKETDPALKEKLWQEYRKYKQGD